MANHLKTLALTLAGVTASSGLAFAAAAPADNSSIGGANAQSLSNMAAVAAAQPATETCTGVITDSEGEPLIGASVLVAGTTLGASTDIDGRFSIKNVPVGSTLKISYIGYQPMEMKWNGGEVNVVLAEDNNVLDEVVVVGFGSQKKANLTGAVSTVSGKEISARPVNNVADALQGLAAGLDVLGPNNGGQLNSTRSMNIRGTGSIGSGSSVSPLVLIDGMEGDINDLNPADVENISVLKDAAASSIYGSRAAGGVILITTKKGGEGRLSINYSDSFRWAHTTRMPKMMDARTWANYMNQASMNSGGGIWFPEDWFERYDAAQADPSKPKMFVNPANNRWEVWDMTNLLPLGNTDWLEEHFGKTSFTQEHNLSMTGGTEKYSFYLSGNFLDQGGILVHGDDNQQRYTVNAKINVKVADWLTVGYSNRWLRQEYDAPSLITKGAAEFYHNVQRYWPIIPTHDPNGYPVVESYIDYLENGGRYKTYKDQTDQQLTLLINPLEGLNIHAEINYRNLSYNEHRDNLQAYGWNGDGEPYAQNPNGTPMGGQGSRVSEYNERSNYFNPNIYADYSRTFAEDHNFKIMGGFQSEWRHYRSFSANRNDVINDLPFLSTTSGKNINVAGNAAGWSTAGWFGRLNYDYAGRYLVEGNIRYDGSSRFRSGSRWTWSPSFSLGWNIAQENFWQDYLNVCNQLKLRYSWGKLGNQNTDNWYPTYSAMGYSQNASWWLVDGQKQTIATMPGLISTSLTWEKNRTWDIGLDWGMFNNRFTGTVDYYNRKTIDMVGPGDVLPGVLGTSVPDVNNLSMTAKGWELTISWRDRIGEVNYGITANLYDHTITVDEYPNENNTLSKYYNGRKLGEIWGYKTIGIAKTNDEMNAHLDALDAAYTEKNGHAPANPRTGQNRLGTGWQAGDIMYADLNGDGIISNGQYTLDDHGDIEVIGNSTPRYNFGLNLEAQWKGFDAKVFFQGTLKRDYMAGGAPFWGAIQQGKWQALGFTEHLDYFRPADTTDPLGPNLDAYYPRVNWGGPGNTQTQTRYLQNAAYCRLKNVTIGYTLPQELTRKFYVDRLRMFVSGENLATITSFTGTGDPELLEAYAEGYGYGKVYPLSRVFSFGLNVTF